MKVLLDREEALLNAVQQLDIAPSKYKQAIERFQAIKSYLENGEYEGCSLKPEVYLQGSFKLGTEIRPFRNSKDADYDIDVVCRLEPKKDFPTAAKIKNLVGDRLKSHGIYGSMLDSEGKRCWTINYAEMDGIGFHIDILPSITEENTFSAHTSYSDSLAITEKNKDTCEYSWKISNPKGFAKWFYSKNREMFDQVKKTAKQAVFENHCLDRVGDIYQRADDVPDIFVKTPLQRAIQLLKRHRDIHFAIIKNENCKPISMIISVLAAQIYRNESTIYETLKNIVSVLDRLAKQLSRSDRLDEVISKSDSNLITLQASGEWCIPNPKNSKENFADRWHLEENGVKHARAREFFDWVKWVKQDFIDISECLDEEFFSKKLGLGGAIKIGGRGISVSIFGVEHCQRPEDKWFIKNTFNAEITASFNKDGARIFKDQSTTYAIKSGDMVPRRKKICFKVHTNTPSPYEVYWQVVNTGDDARNAKCLRGDFYHSNSDCAIEQGKKIRVEPTAYIGDHWVQCFIIQSDVCVAMSEPFVVRVR